MKRHSLAELAHPVFRDASLYKLFELEDVSISQLAFWGEHACEIVEPNIGGNVRIRWCVGPASLWIEMRAEWLIAIGTVAREMLMTPAMGNLSDDDLARLAERR